MINAYSVGIQIHVQSNVAAALNQMRTGLTGVHTQVGNLHSQLQRFHSLAMSAFSAITMGGFVHDLKEAVKEATHLADQISRLRLMGVPEANVQAIRRNAIDTYNSVPGSDIAVNVAHQREAYGLFGSEETAMKVSPAIEKAAILIGKAGGTSAEAAMQKLMKVLELRKGLVDPETGHFTLPQFEKELQAATRALIVMNGNANVDDLRNFMQMFTQYANMMPDPNDFWKAVGPFIEDMGGFRSGTGMAAVMRAFIAGQMPAVNTKELERLGIIDPKFVHENHGRMSVDPAGVKGNELLKRKLVAEWAEKIWIPALIAHGYDTPEKQAAETVHALPTETSRRTLGLAISPQGQEQVKRFGESFDKVPSNDENYKMLLEKDFGTQLLSFTSAWKGFIQVAGDTGIMAAAGKSLVFLGEKIRQVTTWLADPQNATAAALLVDIGVGLVALTATIGTLAIGSALFGAGTIAASGLAILGGPLGLVALAAGVVALFDAYKAIPEFIQKWLIPKAFTDSEAPDKRKELLDKLGYPAGATDEQKKAIDERRSYRPAWMLQGQLDARADREKEALRLKEHELSVEERKAKIEPWRRDNLLHNQNYQVPQQQPKPIQVTTVVNLDGRIVARVVNKVNGDAMDRAPLGGTTGFDPRQGRYSA